MTTTNVQANEIVGTQSDGIWDAARVLPGFITVLDFFIGTLPFLYATD